MHLLFKPIISYTCLTYTSVFCFISQTARQSTAAEFLTFNTVQLDPESGSLQDYDFDELQQGEIISIKNEMTEIHSELQLLVSDDESSDSDVLKATSKALSLTKDRMVDLQLSKSMPTHLQSILKDTLNQITNAEKHVQKVEGILSDFNLNDQKDGTNKSLTNRRQLLSRNQGSVAKYHFNSAVSKADYHHRAKSRHLGQGQGYHPFHFSHQASHQQGYHGARVSREEGTTTHRRLSEDTNVCLPASRETRKAEQCYRLAECAKNYGLYDMYAFFFADDFDFDTGQVDDEDIRVFDERDIKGKVS